MTSISALASTSNWYDLDVCFSITLIESFVMGIETQVIESIKRYDEQKETFVEPIAHDYVRVIDSHQGLDSEACDLHNIFHEYFPSLQRRSALLTMCGYFEHELDKLCHLYQKEKSYKLSLSEINGRGITRSTTYLSKVAEIDAQTSTSEWDNIKSIHKLRNIIVHQDAKIYDKQGNPNKSMQEYIEKFDSLADDNGEVILNGGYLEYVLDLYKKYFELLNQSIQNDITTQTSSTPGAHL